ncbi:hypothetical protein PYV61_26240, partial [Roseisolibacter sp. H3M3-2]
PRFVFLRPLGLRLAETAVGALAMLTGATLQERRRCPACGAGTERAVHGCGTRTVRVGGVPGLGNDAVNVLCGAVGALAGGAAALLAARTG